MGAKRATLWLLLSGLLGLTAVGCTPFHGQHHQLDDEAPLRSTRPRPDTAPETVPQEPANLDDLIEVAVKHHPDLRVAEARIQAARGKMVQAGLFPNPSFGPNFAQLGDSANRLGEPGARLIQTIPTGHKLQLAKAAAAYGVEAADWQAVTKRYDVVTRVRSAYYELLTGLRERDTLIDIVAISEKALQAAERLEKAGAGNRPDVLRAKVELEQNKLKKEISERRVEAARQTLLTTLGRPTLALDRLTGNAADLEQTPPDYEWKTMLDCLRDTSSDLQEARALVVQAEKLVARAEAQVKSDFTVSAIPFYESSARELRGEIHVTAPIPIFDRNQGNIHAAKADLARTHAEEHQRELLLTDRLTLAYQRYQAARQQTDSYHKTIAPQARESLKLVQTGYAAGDKKYDYTAVLQAQQVLFQVQLAHTQAMGEQWRSVVEIAGILQQDDLMSGCAVRAPQ